MNLERVIKSVARLASQSLQIRYCIDGDSNNYILPEELLETAINDANQAIAFGNISDIQRQVLKEFVAIIENSGAFEAVNDDSIKNRELLSSNIAWSQARDAAVKCLANLGVKTPNDNELA